MARTPLEEWISYLKDGRINDDTTTPGLTEAKEKLQYMKMSEEERWAYEHEIMNKVVYQDQIDTDIIAQATGLTTEEINSL